jgi:16S rRNA (cytidine1402-2'-O)-methyltransferase
MARAGRETGKLYLCATPIGNLGDITLRALDVLRDSDVVAAEDTRRTRALFSRYDIHTPLVSYREENREAAGSRLIERLEEGQTVALVSDAGIPGISDPGHHLTKMCLERDIPVEALPGANAALSALVVSGLPTRRFVFEGFLPRKKGPRRKALQALAGERRTLIFYESPSRVADTLADISDIFGERRAALARELTKKFEEVMRGTAGELAGRVSDGQVKGEIVLVVEGAPVRELSDADRERAVDDVLRLKGEGMALKDAVAAVIESEGWAGELSRTALYNAALERQGEE